MTPLKVVHISTSDIGHGAGISCFRLHLALKKQGAQSHIFTPNRISDDPDVTGIYDDDPLVKRYTFKLICLFEALLNFVGPQNLYSLSTLLMKKHPVFQSADIIHVHNIHRTHKYFSLNLLKETSKPIVWTFHDMFPVTGHCFYSFDCERWKRGCGRCPYLSTFVRMWHDTSAYQFRLKQSIYSRSRFKVVTPSEWLTSIARKSPIFPQAISRQTIPYGIDREVFKPYAKHEVRKEFGIPPDRQVISYCASSVVDKRKGYPLMQESLLHIQHALKNTTILLIGKMDAPSQLKEHFDVISTGYISDNDKLARAYSCADIHTMPSIQDNLPNTVLENLACGIPIVAFDQGGIPDMVEHMQNGFLAANQNTVELAKGLQMLLENQNLRETMSRNNLKKVQLKFDESIQAHNYINLYLDMLRRTS
jgi:glycosyltransferase involved in cell wall biosynthesis